MTTINVNEIDPTILEIGPSQVLVDKAKLRELANVIWVDWRERSPKGGIYFGAEPYITAMMALDSVDDAYGADDGHTLVAYFLSNATTWRGPVARVVKRELKRRCRWTS